MKGGALITIVMGLIILGLVGGAFVELVANSIAEGQIIRKSFTVSSPTEDVYVNSSLNTTQLMIKFDVTDFISEAETVVSANLCFSQVDTSGLNNASVALVANQTWTESEVLTIANYNGISVTAATEENITFSNTCLETVNLSQTNLGSSFYTVRIWNGTVGFVGNAAAAFNNTLLYIGNGSQAGGNAIFSSSEGSSSPTLSVQYTYGDSTTNALAGLIPIIFVIGLLIGILVIIGVKVTGKM